MGTSVSFSLCAGISSATCSATSVGVSLFGSCGRHWGSWGPFLSGPSKDAGKNGIGRPSFCRFWYGPGEPDKDVKAVDGVVGT